MILRTLVVALLVRVLLFADAQATEQKKAEVIILGVSHAAQLFVEAYRPAVLRSWIASTEPDIIAIELTERRFKNREYYDFTYEIQGVLIPYANQHGIELSPFDWEPNESEAIRMFGFNLFKTPGIRPSRGWQSFLSFSDEDLEQVSPFYIGEQTKLRERLTNWMDTPVQPTQAEAARRLYLYRTFLQARNIELIAKENPGKRVIVVVGYMHKPDLVRVLSESNEIRLLSSEAFPLPTVEQQSKHEVQQDLYAIAWANLFSSQAEQNGFDPTWIARILQQLSMIKNDSEYRVLKLKYDQTILGVYSYEDLVKWLDLAEAIGPHEEPSWRGGIHEGRIDSDFGPFSALSLRQRALHEAAVIGCKLNENDLIQELHEQITSSLPVARVAHYHAYWKALYENCLFED